MTDGRDSKNGEQPKGKRQSLLSSLAASVSIVVVLLILLELLAGNAWLGRAYPLRSVGNYHSQFEIKWFKLQEFVQQNGGVDVILMGNSMVNTGIDPQVFSEAYEKVTGTHLHVFNFGVEGLTIAPNSRLARLIIETYHPGTLVYFTEMRDYIAANGLEEEKNFLANDWLVYRLGGKNFTGWLVDHSDALQLVLPFRGWMRPDFLDSYILNTRRAALTQGDGYEPETRLREDIDVRPDPETAADKPLFELYGNFEIAPSRLANLDTVLSEEALGTQIFFSEIPVYFTFYDYFGGESIHQAYLKDIEEIITDYGGTFVQPINADLIPLDGRADRLHLNTLGAEVYSTLLADQFADLCKQQQTCLGEVQP